MLPRYVCHRVSRPFDVTGDTSREPWCSCRFSSLIPSYLEGRDDSAAVSIQYTEFAICYSEAAFYVAFRGTDDDIRATYAQHDDPLYDEDVVEVFLSPT